MALDPTAAPRDQNLRDWQALLGGLFPLTLPDQATWTQPDDIIRVLNHLASVNHSHTVYLASRGDIELVSVEHAQEPGLLSITDRGKTAHYIQPAALTFNNVGDAGNYEWAYFLLELKTLQPVTPGQLRFPAEQLVESGPGQYAVYNGQEAQPGSRIMMRLLSGSLLILPRKSRYANFKEAFNGYHAGLDAQTLRGVMHRAATKLGGAGNGLGLEV